MPYSERSDLENQYGVTNVSKWADLNNNEDETEIENRIEWAITVADDEIDNRLRCGPYAIPFADVPTKIKLMSAAWAGVVLYESRGITDFDTEGKAIHKLQHQKTQFEGNIHDILTHRLRLNLAKVSSSVPQVIDDEC